MSRNIVSPGSGAAASTRAEGRGRAFSRSPIGDQPSRRIDAGLLLTARLAGRKRIDGVLPPNWLAEKSVFLGR